LWVLVVIGETTVQFLALSLGEGKRLRVLSDAIPHGLNKLDTFLDAKAQDFFKLGWTHVPKFTPASARMQSARITLRIRRGGRTPTLRVKRGRPARRRLHAVVRRRFHSSTSSLEHKVDHRRYLCCRGLPLELVTVSSACQVWTKFNHRLGQANH
jgi:hypothetical protein